MDVGAGGVGPPNGWVPPPRGWFPYSSAPPIRGAHPWMRERWAVSQMHVCSAITGHDPVEARSIPLSRVNDGVCDCTEGTDEPGTTACAPFGGRFWCAASSPSLSPAAASVADSSASPQGAPRSSSLPAGPYGEWIYSGLVDDGVCDCCDCSDEQGAEASGRAGRCTHGQLSALTPNEPWAPSTRAEEERRLAAAASTVRAARLDASRQARKMASDAAQMASYLNAHQPRSQQEYQHMRQLANQHAMLANALGHGKSAAPTPRPRPFAVSEALLVRRGARPQGCPTV